MIGHKQADKIVTNMSMFMSRNAIEPITINVTVIASYKRGKMPVIS